MWKYEHKQDKKKLGVDLQIRAAKPHARAYKRACFVGLRVEGDLLKIAL